MEEAKGIEEMAHKKVMLQDEIRSYSLDPGKKREAALLPNIPLALRRLLTSSPTALLASASASTAHEAGEAQALSDIHFVQDTTEKLKREKLINDQRLADASGGGAADLPAQHQLIKNGRFGPDIEMFSMPLPAIFPVTVSAFFSLSLSHTHTLTLIFL